MVEVLNTAEVLKMFKHVSEIIQANKDYLCKVDAAIGDGDHGISMAKGFKGAYEQLEAADNIEDMGRVFQIVGMSLMEKIGGATGPIFSTIFLSSSRVAKGKEEADLYLFAEMFKKGAEDVSRRGKSQRGDKTLLDALFPAAEGLKWGAEKGMSLREGFKLAAKKADEGVETTKAMFPKQGKSRYLKDRALGHQDAGATSIAIMFKAMVDYLESV